MARAGRARTAAAAALALAMAACSGRTAVDTSRTPAEDHPAWPGCEAAGAFIDDRGQGPPGTGGVPDGFVPTRVVLCTTDERTTTTGTAYVELERTSTDVAPLVSYLRQPDGLPTQQACTADGWLPPWLVLVDAGGRYVAPQIPVDGCGKPLGWYDRRDDLAWDALRYTDRVLGPVKNQAQQLSCPSTQPDVFASNDVVAHRASGRFAGDLFAGQPVRLCVYDTPPGSFVTGQTLLPDERSTLLTSLAASPEAPSRCTTPSAQLGVIGSRTGGPRLFVELDGCHRVVSDQQPTPVVRADDELVALLGG